MLTNLPDPLVSVVMPVYDPHPRFFIKAVRSILAQRRSNFELIIVEDPSKTSGKELLKDISDPRVRHFCNSERTTLVRQRNRGLMAARGRFVAFMDADDIAHPYRLVTQCAFLLQHTEIGVVGSNVTVIDDDDRVVGHRWFPGAHDDIRTALVCRVPVCQPAVMIRREVVLRHGGYACDSPGVAEDYEYWSRLIQAGVRFATIADPLLFYRIHGNQIKQSHFRATIRGVMDVRKRFWMKEHTMRARLQSFAESLMLCMPRRMATALVLRHLWHYRPGPSCHGMPYRESVSSTSLSVEP